MWKFKILVFERLAVIPCHLFVVSERNVLCEILVGEKGTICLS